MKRALVEKLRCIVCSSTEIGLVSESQEQVEIVTGALKCGRCGSVWPIVNGVACMLPPLNAAKEDERVYYDSHISPTPREPQNLDYGSGWSLRPPKAHTDMLDFHLNRVFRHLSIVVAGKEVIDVGGGPGKEAEYLCRKQQATVVGLDVASNAVCAALERSKRFGYFGAFDGIAGDMECLPFRDITRSMK